MDTFKKSTCRLFNIGIGQRVRVGGGRIRHTGLSLLIGTIQVAVFEVVPIDECLAACLRGSCRKSDLDRGK